MRRWWSADELVERWSLTPEDLSLLVGRIDAGKLGLAAQLAYWRRYGAPSEEHGDDAPRFGSAGAIYAVPDVRFGST